MASQCFKVQILIYLFPSKIWLVWQLCKGLWLMRIWCMVLHQFWVMILCICGRKGTTLILILLKPVILVTFLALSEIIFLIAKAKYYRYFTCRVVIPTADRNINWWIHLLIQILLSPPFPFFLSEYSCALLTQW